MLKRRSKIVRGFLVMLSAVSSIGHLARGIWQNKQQNRWLVPLAVFLAATGILLVLAATVEVIAPFIYTIF